jgi:hypothetical protein
MDNGLSSLYVKPREWQEWVIGTFDPTFKEPARFFAGWDTNDDEAIMALLVRQEHGYDKAQRMTTDEADDEIMLVQACVGPDVFVYKMPYLPPSPAKNLNDVLARHKPKAVAEQKFEPLNIKSTITKHTRIIDGFNTVVLALLLGSLIATAVGV